MKAIADTGFVVAFANRADRFHDWAVSVANGVKEPMLTCEAVLAEAAFHLQGCLPVFGMVEDGLLTIAFDSKQHFAHLAELAVRYSDRKPDFADLCLIRMSELFPRHSVVTVDREDFRVYRRNKRDAIPLICPPEQ